MKKIFHKMKTQLKKKLQKSNFHNTNKTEKALQIEQCLFVLHLALAEFVNINTACFE